MSRPARPGSTMAVTGVATTQVPRCVGSSGSSAGVTRMPDPALPFPQILQRNNRMPAKSLVIAIVALVIGFGSGFVLRPVLLPGADAVGSSEPRGTQYFETTLDQARTVIAHCRDGMVRGADFPNATIAVSAAAGTPTRTER